MVVIKEIYMQLNFQDKSSCFLATPVEDENKD